MKLVFKDHTPILVSYTLYTVVGNIILGQKAGALALFPFIIVRDKKFLSNEDIIRHESIHLRQYVETLLVGLFVIAFFQYIYMPAII